MLDFLNDVPDVAWAALVTGVFLTGQNFLNNRRDDKRRKDDAAERKADRQFQLDQAERARSDARVDTWREERMSAHDALITQLRIVQRTIHTRLARYHPSTADYIGGQASWSPILQDDNHEKALEDAGARVEIVASEAAKQLAVETLGLIGKMDTEYWFLAVIHTGDEPERQEERKKSLAKLKGWENQMKEMIDSYIAAVRKDLGTAD